MHVDTNQLTDIQNDQAALLLEFLKYKKMYIQLCGFKTFQCNGLNQCIYKLIQKYPIPMMRKPSGTTENYPSSRHVQIQVDP